MLIMVFFFGQINGPTWQVPLGRRDGRVSILSEATTNLPTPFDNFTTLKTRFGSLGLSVKDLVVLSGKNYNFIMIKGNLQKSY